MLARFSFVQLGATLSCTTMAFAPSLRNAHAFRCHAATHLRQHSLRTAGLAASPRSQFGLQAKPAAAPPHGLFHVGHGQPQRPATPMARSTRVQAPHPRHPRRVPHEFGQRQLLRHPTARSSWVTGKASAEPPRSWPTRVPATPALLSPPADLTLAHPAAHLAQLHPRRPPHPLPLACPYSSSVTSSTPPLVRPQGSSAKSSAPPFCSPARLIRESSAPCVACVPARPHPRRSRPAPFRLPTI